MGSYLPPYLQNGSFNTNHFKSTLTSKEIESKIKKLKAKNKQVIKTGVYTSDGSFGTKAISYGVTYDEPPIVLVNSNVDNDLRFYHCTAREITTTNFGVRRHSTHSGTSNTGGSNHSFHWMAIGNITK